ncbi:acyl-CoA/acyl-ACP dehydrogenase [Streptacidiphilus sp. PB12-B1b]|uniref:acyl-CoA dehydrogenase family protein n=1 Tax=Streptacidiphilus sp. PB12-B1b TaxID=2705012 RepID=UPI0015FB19EC|nr:acyl-CoA dehydrogenase family protein [Streptacidiphilus sp. PB12-B1b]QMU78282.1 acyl-CoA/acyl-ACP dehydrogenase [Streptacidiphilus sp. PB12-B1b]
MSAHTHEQTVAEVVAVLRRHARQVDAEARFPAEGMQALRDSGLLGLLVPRVYGGLGCGLDCLVRIAAELAGGCLSTALVWAMHCQQTDVVARHGSEELRAELLPRIAAGKEYLASVTTEAAKGGHLLTALTPLRTDDMLLRIERDAPVVTGGTAADGFLITMRAGEDAAPHEVSLVYASRDQVAVDVVGTWNPLGMRGTHSPGLKLSGGIPPGQVIGAPGEFRDIALESMIPLAHLGWSACWLGAARGLMRELVAAVRDRSWPVDLASDLLRERLARIRVDLELVSGYLFQVCTEVRQARADGRSLGGPAEQIHLNVLKVAASELTFRAADRMMQLAGLSRGYTGDSPVPVERVFRDLRSAALNNSNDRLLIAIGALVPMDRSVRLL